MAVGIGVAGDVKHQSLTDAPRLTAYWAHPQLAMSSMTITVRSSSGPSALVPEISQEIRALDKDLPLSDVQAMEQWVAASRAQSRTERNNSKPPNL